MAKRVELSRADRDKVQMMAGLGMKDDEIARVMSVSEASIKRHCAAEMAKGRSVALSQVAATAYRMATSGKCPAATFFWLKCRGGWREVQRVEVDSQPKQLAID